MDDPKTNIDNVDSNNIKKKPKRRSIVERELESNLTDRVISPIIVDSTEAANVSRYGRARKYKPILEIYGSKDVTKAFTSPKINVKPVVTSPSVKMYASNSPIKKDPYNTSLDSCIENLHNQTVALSRFVSPDEHKLSPSKTKKVCVRKDLTRQENEETASLLKNMFSPVKSPVTLQAQTNDIPRVAEKSKSQNSYFQNSAVKVLDFECDVKKKKNPEDIHEKTIESKQILNMEENCGYQVGDLAWSRVGTYPFWPCIVTRDPYLQYVQKKMVGRSEKNFIHVTFLADNGRRGWIKDTMLRKYIGREEFEQTREQFTAEDKKKDPKLYAAFCISDKNLPKWNVSVEEAEVLLKVPKIRRLEVFYDMLHNSRMLKIMTHHEKGKILTRKSVDVSLSETLFDSLFSPDNSDAENTSQFGKKRTAKSLDVSDVVTACLDNMAAKTGMSVIQKQSHMDIWLQKAKSQTPEKPTKSKINLQNKTQTVSVKNKSVSKNTKMNGIINIPDASIIYNQKLQKTDKNVSFDIEKDITNNDTDIVTKQNESSLGDEQRDSEAINKTIVSDGMQSNPKSINSEYVNIVNEVRNENDRNQTRVDNQPDINGLSLPISVLSDNTVIREKHLTEDCSQTLPLSNGHDFDDELELTKLQIENVEIQIKQTASSKNNYKVKSHKDSHTHKRRTPNLNKESPLTRSKRKNKQPETNSIVDDQHNKVSHSEEQNKLTVSNDCSNVLDSLNNFNTKEPITIQRMVVEDSCQDKVVINKYQNVTNCLDVADGPKKENNAVIRTDNQVDQLNGNSMEIDTLSSLEQITSINASNANYNSNQSSKPFTEVNGDLDTEKRLIPSKNDESNINNPIDEGDEIKYITEINCTSQIKDSKNESVQINFKNKHSDIPLKKPVNLNHKSDPEFIKYLELKQDEIMDGNPHLSADEIVTYLYKTWLYEGNNINEEELKDDNVHIKDHSNKKTVPKNKTRKRDNLNVKPNCSIESYFTRQISQRRANLNKCGKDIDDSEIHKGTQPLKNEGYNTEDKIKEAPNDNRKVNNESNKTGYYFTPHNVEQCSVNLHKSDSTQLSFKKKYAKGEITSSDDDIDRLIYSSENEDENETKKLNIESQTLIETVSETAPSDNNSVEHELPEQSNCDNEIARMVISENTTKETKLPQETECDDEILKMDVSETDITQMTNTYTTKKCNNPEFVKYLELKQDAVIDENPHLHADEVLTYLYKTWLYEKNNINEEELKDDDVQIKDFSKKKTVPKNKIRYRDKVNVNPNYNIESYFTRQIQQRKANLNKCDKDVDDSEIHKGSQSLKNDLNRHGSLTKIYNAESKIKEGTNNYQKDNAESNKTDYDSSPLNVEQFSDNLHKSDSTQLSFQNTCAKFNGEVTSSDDDIDRLIYSPENEDENETKKLNLENQTLIETVSETVLSEHSTAKPEFHEQSTCDNEIAKIDISENTTVETELPQETECDDEIRKMDVSETESAHITNAYRTEKHDHPEFVKYLELKQDAVMDENPHLTSDEIVTYVYKTWLYEQNNINDITDDKILIKGFDMKDTIQDKPISKTKVQKEQLNTMESYITRERPVRIRNSKVCYIDANDSDLDDFVCETPTVKSQPIEPARSEDLSQNYAASTVNTNDKKINVDPNMSASVEHPNNDSQSKNKSIHKVISINDISNDHKNNKNDELKEVRLDMNSIKSVEEDDIDGLSETDTTEINSNQASEIAQLQNSCKNEISQNDSSENEGGNFKDTNINKKYDDPEFAKYLELKQDEVMDENPHLNADEIVSYLYKTWLYEQNNVNEEFKDDQILIKGFGEKTLTIPNKVRKRVKVKKEFSYSIEQYISKERSQRKKKSKTYYSDTDDTDDGESNDLEIPKEAKAISKSQPLVILQDINLLEAKKDIKNGETVCVDEVQLYFAELTKQKPNLFKGLAREKVCEICDRPTNLVKCKGLCGDMYHLECVKKQVEPLNKEPVLRGRKKKKVRSKKNRSMTDDKTNGTESESHSDEKSQDVNLSVDGSQNMSIEESDGKESHVIPNIVDFEAQMSAKMVELIEGNKEADIVELCSSGDELDWNDVVAGNCEIVDVKLKMKDKSPEKEYSDFKCNDCQKYQIPQCFVCKSAVSPKSKVETRQKCNLPYCHKYYHLECLEHWPQTQFSSGESGRSKNFSENYEAMTCPRHVCHTCVCDDPRGCKTRFSGDKLAKCIRCPAVYHSFTKCLPAGTQILTGSHIICPRHFENRPGKAPCHVNTGWCFICALGGTLICCEYCPTSFHAECLNFKPPEGGYMCEECETGRLPLYGEMVWVKLGHYRWWPGLILHPIDVPSNIRSVKHSPGEFVVRFFGQYDHYWVNRGRVFPYQEGDTGNVSSQKSKLDAAFSIAMEHAQKAYEILKNAKLNEHESTDIASSLLPPHYVKLKVNKPYGSVVNWKPDDSEANSLTQCDCNPDCMDPCGPDTQCLNRMLLTECGPMCRAGDRCNNRYFEKRLSPKLVPYRTPHRGWGLKTLEDIKKGQFVIEYVGELIDEEEFRRRMRRKHEIRDENFYFLTLDKDRMIDAGPKGNLARFMNHCCEPNCETQKWTVLGDVRVGLFAMFNIPANSEVTFNYNLECTGIEKKRCMCGAKRCSGFIGAKPKQDEKPKNPKRVNKKKKPVNETPSTSKAVQKPRSSSKKKTSEEKMMSELEKDLMIIRNATNGMSSDSDEDKMCDEQNAVKRKRTSSEEFAVENDNAKKMKTDNGDYSEMGSVPK